jgi:hypothetical protein
MLEHSAADVSLAPGFLKEALLYQKQKRKPSGATCARTVAIFRKGGTAFVRSDKIALGFCIPWFTIV